MNNSNRLMTYLFKLFVCRELDGAIRDNSNAVDPISSHKSLETFLPPHANETLPHPRVLLSRISRLDLSVRAAVKTRKPRQQKTRTE